MQGFPWTKPLPLTNIRQNLKEPILDLFAIVDIVQLKAVRTQNAELPYFFTNGKCYDFVKIA